MFASFYNPVSEQDGMVDFPKEDPTNGKGVNKLNLEDGFTNGIEKVLTSKLTKINELNEINNELESQISGLVKDYDFRRDPLGYNEHPTISKHDIFINAKRRFEQELDCVSYYIAVSSKYRIFGYFLSDLWNHCKFPNDSESNIRAIVIMDEFNDDLEYVIKHPLMITAFMESYLLPPYRKPSLFSRYMGVNSIEWPHGIVIYTDKYIYEGTCYDEDYVYNGNVMMPFSKEENEEDLKIAVGYRQHFEFNVRNIEDLNDSVLKF